MTAPKTIVLKCRKLSVPVPREVADELRLIFRPPTEAEQAMERIILDSISRNIDRQFGTKS